MRTWLADARCLASVDSGGELGIQPSSDAGSPEEIVVSNETDWRGDVAAGRFIGERNGLAVACALHPPDRSHIRFLVL
jgi:hypothetical protein